MSIRTQISALIRNRRTAHIAPLVHREWAAGNIPPDELARCIAWAWHWSDYPQDAIPESAWNELFDACGYILDGATATPPTGPTVLYRGATPQNKARWTWTDNVLAALSYTGPPRIKSQLRTRQDERPNILGPRGQRHGTVWTVTAPPSALRMRIRNGEFDEYVINPDGLSIGQARPELMANQLRQYADANGLHWPTMKPLPQTT